jgi:hypothetical protein
MPAMNQLPMTVFRSGDLDIAKWRPGEEAEKTSQLSMSLVCVGGRHYRSGTDGIISSFKRILRYQRQERKRQEL